MVIMLDIYPANLSSNPTVTDMGCGRYQDGHPDMQLVMECTLIIIIIIIIINRHFKMLN